MYMYIYLYTHTHTQVPSELLNNIAALYHKRGLLAQAQVFYTKALKQLGVKPPSDAGELLEVDTPEVQAALRGSAVSILYNMARLNEDMRRPAYAEGLYRSLCVESETYTHVSTTQHVHAYTSVYEHAYMHG